MSVNLIWRRDALINDPLAAPVSHGDVGNGSATTPVEIFVSHNGANPITNCGIYMRPFSGTYSGTHTASADFSELINWGDQNTVGGFGGFQVHMGVPTGYISAWPTYNTKTTSETFCHRSGVGDSEGNAVTLLAICTSSGIAGQINDGSAARFQTRVVVPGDEDTIGIRQWDHVLKFDFTS
jgi:hypothetical protein